MLLVTADQDFTAVEEKRRYLSQLADAKMEVIPHSQHITHLDQPEAFNRIVLEFRAAAAARTRVRRRQRRRRRLRPDRATRRRGDGR